MHARRRYAALCCALMVTSGCASSSKTRQAETTQSEITRNPCVRLGPCDSWRTRRDSNPRLLPPEPKRPARITSFSSGFGGGALLH